MEEEDPETPQTVEGVNSYGIPQIQIDQIKTYIISAMNEEQKTEFDKLNDEQKTHYCI